MNLEASAPLESMILESPMVTSRNRGGRRTVQSTRKRRTTALPSPHRVAGRGAALGGGGLGGVRQGADGVAGGVVVGDRPADRADRSPPGDGVELGRQLGRHPPCQFLAAGGQDIGGKAPRALNRGQSV